MNNTLQLELLVDDPLTKSIKCESDLHEVLATLSADGWEVVSVSVVKDGYVVNAQRSHTRFAVNAATQRNETERLKRKDRKWIGISAQKD